MGHQPRAAPGRRLGRRCDDERLAFHVEIRRSLQHARAFNLDAQELRRTVLEPWVAGATVTLGDREWEPRHCGLRILEGPALAPGELSLGRGWQRAERTARDVTTQALAGGAAVAVIAAGPAAEREAEAALAALNLTAIRWPAARARLLAGGGPPLAAALVVLDDAEPDGFAFQAGLAYGALRGRVVFACRGAAPPPAWLENVALVALDEREELAARLRPR
jgi:hypothetical protein